MPNTPTAEVPWTIDTKPRATDDQLVRRTKPTCVAPYHYVQAVVVRRSSTVGGIPAIRPVDYVVEFWWTVTTVEGGLRRPFTTSLSTGQDRDLAARLATAVEAGRAFTNPRVVHDVDGSSYVEADRHFSGRTLRADLVRMGL